MATAITVNCPECDKTMKVPADARGKRVRCKGCEHVFVFPGAPAKAGKPGSDKAKPAKPESKPSRPADDEDGDGKPYGVTTLDLTPRCPDCVTNVPGISRSDPDFTWESTSKAADLRKAAGLGAVAHKPQFVVT